MLRWVCWLFGHWYKWVEEEKGSPYLIRKCTWCGKIYRFDDMVE